MKKPRTGMRLLPIHEGLEFPCVYKCKGAWRRVTALKRWTPEGWEYNNGICQFRQNIAHWTRIKTPLQMEVLRG